jgi:hypothetical protein
LKIQVAGQPGQATPSRDRDAIAAIADVGEWLQAEHGLAIREIQVPQRYQHPPPRATRNSDVTQIYTASRWSARWAFCRGGLSPNRELGSC